MHVSLEGSRASPASGATASTVRFTPASRRRRSSTRTPLAPSRAARFIARAWEQATGQPPSAETTGVLWSQWALETGRGRSMHGHNFGGLKGQSPGGHSQRLWTTEGHGTEAARIRSRFRAYDTPAEGALDYVETMRRDYPEAFAAAAAGEPESFVAGLSRKGYFTGSPEVYRRSIRSLSREYQLAGPDRPLRVTDPGPHVQMLLFALQRAMRRD